jgi:hypothetical protein
MPTFTASELQRINLMAEANGTDSRLQAEYKPYADAALAVLENQTATFTPLLDRNKDNKLAVVWLDTCDIEAEDCVPNCAIDGSPVSSKALEYTLDLCKKVDFSVDETELRGNTFDMQTVAGKAQAKALKTLDEWLNTQTLLRLKQYAGINVAPSPYIFNAANMTTQVPYLDYQAPKIVTRMLRQAYMNKMGTPYYIDNGALWDAWQDAKFDNGNSEGKGNAARIAALSMYFDLFGFMKAGLQEDTFMVSNGAIAIGTRVTHPDSPKEMLGSVQQTWYTVNSPTLPGVKYDVFYTYRCDNVGGKAHIVHSWRFEVNAGIWKNPGGCPVTVNSVTYEPTGILSYTQLNPTT